MIVLGADLIIKDKFAAMPAGDCGHAGGNHGQQHTPGQNRRSRIIKPNDPVCAEHRQQHDGEDEMSRTGRADAYAGNRQKLHRSDNPCDDTDNKADSRRPDCHAGPEQVARPPIKSVTGKGAKGKCDREGDHHGMHRVASYSDFRFRRVEGFAFLNRVNQSFLGSRSHARARPRLCVTGNGSNGRGHWYKTAVVALVPAIAGCQGPLSTLDPAGPSASLVAGLWWAMLIGAGMITGFVLILLAVAWRRPGGTGTDERVWTLGLGVGFVMSVLVALVGYGFWVGERILPREDGTVRVKAEARQWGWVFTQPGPDGEPLLTHDVLYVPAGVPFDIEITATDVIHSFWVPRLGGKMDAVPGRTNVARLTADVAGEHEGLCAEFCGVGHSFMRFTVVAYEAGAFPDLELAQTGGDDE